MYELLNRYYKVVATANKLHSQIHLSKLNGGGEDSAEVQFLKGLLSSTKEEQTFWENTLDNTIFIAWSEEDVLSVNPLLSKKDVDVILDVLVRKHDAEYGINWETIRCTIDLYLDDEYHGRDVKHSKYGEGVLQEFGNDFISITFDDGRNVGFTRKEFDEQIKFI